MKPAKLKMGIDCEDCPTTEMSFAETKAHQRKTGHRNYRLDFWEASK